MSLQVWLPLIKDLRQQGLSNITVTNNGATFNSAGKLGGCYLFDGSNDYMVGTYNATAEISFAAWINMPVLPGGKHIFDARTSAGSGYQPMYLTNTSIQVGCSGSGSGHPSFNYAWVANTWYHICVTHNTTEVKCYVNGVLIGSSTGGKGVSLGTCNFTLGSRCNQANYSNVKINDVRIYDHCLSEQEIKKISQGLIVHYPLNRNGWGQDNLISNSITKTSSGYNVSNWTCTANTSVSNWGCTDAYRCTGSGGTNTIIGTLGIGQPSNSNFTYSYSVWVKNNHSTNKIAFSTNHAGYYSEWLSPGQAKRLTVEGAPGNGSSYIQLNWRTNIVGEAFDFSYWRPKIEIGNKVTPWTPGSSDLLAGIELNNTTEYDISGFGNNGIRVGTFEWSSDTPKYKVSTVFNASHPDYIKIPYTNHAIQGAKEMTWSIWAYDDDWSTYSGRIYSCTEGGGVNIEDGGSTLNWAVNMYTAADYSTYAYQGYCSISKASLSSGWHMFTWVYTTTGTKVYVDGVLKSTIDINSYGIHFANTALYLGAEAQGETTSTGYYLTGKLSDFRIYATALSANDVKSLHQNCATIDSDGTTYGQIRN